MIGGLTANLIASPFAIENNGNYSLVFFYRRSFLTPEAIYALSTAKILLDPNKESLIEKYGNKVFMISFNQFFEAYQSELSENQNIEMPIAETRDNTVIAKEGVSPLCFESIAFSASFLAGIHNKEQIHAMIDAQRIASSITNKREIIEICINLALLANSLTENKNKNEKIITAFFENLIGEEIKSWEYFNISGFDDQNPFELCHVIAACILDSKDYTDAIRKSISCFYHSSSLSLIVGLMAEKLYGVPKDISNQGYTLIMDQSETIYEQLRQYEEKFPPKIFKVGLLNKIL